MSMVDVPSNIEARVTLQKPTLVKSDKLWFDDGSLVLIVGSLMFRVHFSMLQRKSAFFRHMAGIPQPENQPKIEGCPVVYLDDDVESFELFLLCIFDADNGLDTASVARIFAMSNKYLATTIESHCGEYFNTFFPTSLKGWDARGSADDIDGLVSAFACALKLDMPWHIPAICCEVVAFGGHSERSTRIILPEILDKFPLPSRLIILMGASSVFNGVSFIVGEMRGTRGAHCQTQVLCESHRQELATEWLSGDQSDPLGFGIGKDRRIWDDMRRQLCYDCVSACKKQWRMSRTDFWDDLPIAFGLGDWEELFTKETAFMSRDMDEK
ncbi:hypothetical protein B0H11DRAFT_1915280 [Mycena galericulata]|nr:hypothetical protein B0H11DRAFT_1915280 [Mycena galericulata]